MPSPLKLCVIGAGKHTLTCHLPSLAHYSEKFAGRVVVTAVADPVAARTESAAKILPGIRTYVDTAEMLERERPDACVATTPVRLNAATAIQLMRAGIPVLMEKPLGATIEEAREVVRVAAATKARVMVSMNRRFDPQVNAALAWIGRREIRYLRATMARHNRPENQFLEETGVHLVDVIRMIVGDVRSWSTRRYVVNGSRWVQAQLEFESGGYGLVDLLPTTGSNTEVIELFGADFSVEIHSAESDRGWRAWSNEKCVEEQPTPTSTPEFMANGTYAETEAFLEGLLEGRPFHPVPAEVLPSMELCHAVALGETSPRSSTSR